MTKDITLTSTEFAKFSLLQARLENRQKALESALSSDDLQMIALTNKNLQAIEELNDDIKEANKLFKILMQEIISKNSK